MVKNDATLEMFEKDVQRYFEAQLDDFSFEEMQRIYSDVRYTFSRLCFNPEISEKDKDEAEKMLGLVGLEHSVKQIARAFIIN